MTNEKMDLVIKKEEKSEKYLYMVFSLLKKRDDIILSDKEMHFSNTEIRLLFEILSAEYEGKRLISTQLAKILGITRSAVSQIVNRLEERGVVKRVADDVDRKIAYIEITEPTMEAYREDLKNCQNFIQRVIDQFGEENFDTMFTLLNDFVNILGKEKKNTLEKNNLK
ncbi:MAG: MarR family transcriptional regulator [Clostridiales bacterium]|nr:MarR family transcriptional regulator [Clostridiales bacterium]